MTTALSFTHITHRATFISRRRSYNCSVQSFQWFITAKWYQSVREAFSYQFKSVSPEATSTFSQVSFPIGSMQKNECSECSVKSWIIDVFTVNRISNLKGYCSESRSAFEIWMYSSYLRCDTTWGGAFKATAAPPSHCGATCEIHHFCSVCWWLFWK